ncbi:hypothetical protein T492DRAFT_938529 [Pavlovales sp. CCMP2436]|nr:hypothetical protein T492DRAFT_938529 [Pavlovales sp. CCMP2436]
MLVCTLAILGARPAFSAHAARAHVWTAAGRAAGCAATRPRMVAREEEDDVDHDRPLAFGETSDKWTFAGGMDVSAFLAGIEAAKGDVDLLVETEKRGEPLAARSKRGNAPREERRASSAQPAPSRAAPRAEESAEQLVERARGQHSVLARFTVPLVPVGSVELAATVRQVGVARATGVLRPETAAALREFVLAEVARSEAEVASGAVVERERFSEVLSGCEATGAPRTRWDLRLPLAPPVVAAVDELLGGDAPLAFAFGRLAGGGKAELWEMAAIVSAPGSAPQLLHADTLWSPKPCLFTAFVALQSVTREMGPTVFLTRSHEAEEHKRCSAMAAGGAGAEPLEGAAAELGIMEAGDATLYDSRVLHAGGANRSGETRVLAYLTFRGVGASAATLGNEAAHSIRPQMAAQRIRLGDLRRGAGLLAPAEAAAL